MKVYSFLLSFEVPNFYFPNIILVHFSPPKRGPLYKRTKNQKEGGGGGGGGGIEHLEAVYAWAHKMLAYTTTILCCVNTVKRGPMPCL